MTIGVQAKNKIGIKINLLKIFKNKSQNPHTIKKLSKEFIGKCLITNTDSGWMNNVAIQQYCKYLVQQIRLSYLPHQRKSLLVLDTYKYHENQEMLKYLEKHNIDTLFIPGETTSVLQPLDVSVNKPIKQCVNNYFIEWQQLMQDCSKIPTNHQFIRWIIDSLTKVNSQIIINSFEITGLILEMNRSIIYELSSGIKQYLQDYISQFDEQLMTTNKFIEDPYRDSYQVELQDLFFNETKIEQIKEGQS